MGAKDEKRAKANRARALLAKVAQDQTGDGQSNPDPAENHRGKGVYVKGKTLLDRHEPIPIDPRHHPKKHSPGSLRRGDSVWYRDTRYWIESAPVNWEHTCTVRVSDMPIHPDPDREPPKNRATFCCHADLVDLAPTAKNRFDSQPTKAAEERKERAKAGQKDIGDEVADMLRGKTLDEAYTATARFLRVPEDELRQKYSHLNPGQQRMNLGNKIRSTLKKGK